MEDLVFHCDAIFTSALSQGLKGHLRLVRSPSASTSNSPSSASDDLFVLIVPLQIRHPLSSTKLEAQSKSDLANSQITVKLTGSTELPFLDIKFLDERDLQSFRNLIPTPSSDASHPPALPLTSKPEFKINQYYVPVKVAKYFNEPEGMGGPWKVSMSSDAISTYRQLPSNMAEIVFRKVNSLANGEFEGDNGKQLSTVDKTHGVPIYEAKMTGNLRIVWAIDIEADQDRDEDIQVIKIYGIWTHAQIMNKPSKKLVDHPSRGQPAHEDFVELHRLLSLEKYTACSHAAFSAFRSSPSENHIFQLAYQEQAIVNHLGSIFVLGRGGTGKTTTMLIKMLGTQRAFQLTRPPRQLFTTQSSFLARKVKESFESMSKSLDFVMLPEEERAALRTRQFVAAASKTYSEEPEVFVNKIPSKWSDLDDSHFPLFVSFDQLCSLLEGDLVPVSPITNERPPLVTHRLFLLHYWPTFNQKLVASLDCFLVYGEILGVIKGGGTSISTGALTRIEYENLSARAHLTFAHLRPTIYSIYLAYEKLKTKLGQRDTADRTLTLLRAMDGKFPDLGAIDFVYVDEAQDNLIIDCSLIRKICSSSSNFFFANDGAQTIAAGSSFRFADLSSHFYREEEAEAKKSNRDPQRPGTFQLSRNYRSHSGICRLADEVVDMLANTFEGSVDRLEPEDGLVLGPLPEFFEKREEGSTDFLQLFTREGTAATEFGAQQVILVRDDASKEAFKQFIGPENDVGLVLTILQAKGLEFSDVLIWNFFEHSTATASQWRLLMKDMPNEYVPAWDPTKHAVLCTELKTLYVAITRARHNVWVWDDSDKSKYMSELFAFKGLIEILKASEPLPRLAAASDQGDYDRLAQELLGRHLYDDASKNFRKAGKRLDADYCLVLRQYELEKEKAVKIPNESLAKGFCAVGSRAELNGRHLIRTDAFAKAGEIYVELKMPKRAAEAFEAAGMVERALEQIDKVDAPSRSAVEIFLAGKRFEDAARRCLDEGDVRRAVGIFKQGDLWDDVLAIEIFEYSNLDEAVRICLNEDLMSLDAWSEVIELARNVYLSSGEKATWRKSDKLFETYDEQIRWMEKSNLLTYKPVLLERLSRFTEAAAFFRSEGKFLTAAQTQVRLETSSSMQKAFQYVVEGLLLHIPLGSSIKPPGKATKNRVRELLQQGRLVIMMEEGLRRKEKKEVKDKKDVKVDKDMESQLNLLELAITDGPAELAAATRNLLHSSPRSPFTLLALINELRYIPSETVILEKAVETMSWFLAFANEASSRFKEVDLSPSHDRVSLALVGLYDTPDPRKFKLSRRSRLQFDPNNPLRPARKSTVLKRIRVVHKHIVQEHLIVALERWRVTPLLEGKKDPLSSIRLPVESTFASLSSTLSIVFYEMIFEEMVVQSRLRHQLVLHDSKYWVKTLSDLLLPTSLSKGSRSSVTVASLPSQALPIVARHLLLAFDEIDPSKTSLEICIRIAQNIVDLLDFLVPAELKTLVVSSPSPSPSILRNHSAISLPTGTSAIRLLLSHLGQLRLVKGSLEQFVHTGLSFIQFAIKADSLLLDSFLELLERIVVLSVLGVRSKESMSLNGLTAPLSLLRKLQTTLSYDIDPSATLDYVGRVLRQVTQLAIRVDDQVVLDRVMTLEVFFTESVPRARDALLSFCRSQKGGFFSVGSKNRYFRAQTWNALFESFLLTDFNSLDPVVTLVASFPSSSPDGAPSYPPTAVSPLQVRYTSWNHLRTSLLVISTSDKALFDAKQKKAPTKVANLGPWKQTPPSFAHSTIALPPSTLRELSQPFIFTEDMFHRTEPRIQYRSTVVEPLVEPEIEVKDVFQDDEVEEDSTEQEPADVTPANEEEEEEVEVEVVSDEISRPPVVRTPVEAEVAAECKVGTEQPAVDEAARSGPGRSKDESPSSGITVGSTEVDATVEVSAANLVQPPVDVQPSEEDKLISLEGGSTDAENQFAISGEEPTPSTPVTFVSPSSGSQPPLDPLPLDSTNTLETLSQLPSFVKDSSQPSEPGSQPSTSSTSDFEPEVRVEAVEDKPELGTLLLPSIEPVIEDRPPLGILAKEDVELEDEGSSEDEQEEESRVDLVDAPLFDVESRPFSLPSEDEKISGELEANTPDTEACSDHRSSSPPPPLEPHLSTPISPPPLSSPLGQTIPHPSMDQIQSLSSTSPSSPQPSLPIINRAPLTTDLTSLSTEALACLALKNAEKKIALLEQLLYGGEDCDGDDPVVVQINILNYQTRIDEIKAHLAERQRAPSPAPPSFHSTFEENDEERSAYEVPISEVDGDDEDAEAGNGDGDEGDSKAGGRGGMYEFGDEETAWRTTPEDETVEGVDEEEEGEEEEPVLIGNSWRLGRSSLMEEEVDDDEEEEEEEE